MLKKHQSSKPKAPKFTRVKKQEEAPVKVALPKLLTLEDCKQQLNAWAASENIPGKFQSWYTKPTLPENADWRILNKLVGGHEVLTIDPPARGMEPIELVLRIKDQLQKEHLRLFKKTIRQIWLRSTGDGQFGMLLQANLRGKNSAHGYKTFLDFVQRSCPEVISCTQIQCTPNQLFNPSGKNTMRIESKCSFGSEFLPIASTGFYMHILDWAPRLKEAWIGLPERIMDAIHPVRGDKLLELYSGSSFVGASLANVFQQVETLDCRESAMLSTRMNAKLLPEDNLHFHRSHAETSFLVKFFSKASNDGRWTIYINLPESETLDSEMEHTLASCRPERILFQTPDLETAAKEIKRFRREGYMLRKSIPLYLEPGSGKFEVLFLFVPDRSGLLGLPTQNSGKKGAVQRPREQVLRKNTGDTPHFTQKSPTFKQRKG